MKKAVEGIIKILKKKFKIKIFRKFGFGNIYCGLNKKSREQIIKQSGYSPKDYTYDKDVNMCVDYCTINIQIIRHRVPGNYYFKYVITQIGKSVSNNIGITSIHFLVESKKSLIKNDNKNSSKKCISMIIEI
jgi:hypothetical protein